MNPDNITDGGLSDASQLNAADPATAVGNGAQVTGDTMTLAEINQHLGKQFTNKESALKALSDTFSYVGKKKDDIAAEIRTQISQDTRADSIAKELEEMRKERFFDKNPSYAEPSVRKLIDSIGGNPSDVVNTPEFKSIFEKIEGYDKTQKLRTVLESNPRLSSSKDNLTKAAEAKRSGAPSADVEQLAVNAILDAYEM